MVVKIMDYGVKLWLQLSMWKLRLGLLVARDKNQHEQINIIFILIYRITTWFFCGIKIIFRKKCQVLSLVQDFPWHMKMNFELGFDKVLV